ncbi:MAG TPA: amino acid permease [Caulobacteraceae bacterium]
MSQPDGGPRKLGPFLAALVVAGSMVGSGVYLLPASLGAIGSISILGWIGAILGASLLAGVFSFLAILRPDGGGLFPLIRDALGPGVGFVVGVLYWCPVANVPVALAVTGYLSFFVPQAANGVGAMIASVSIIWLFVAANILGARFVAKLGGWTLAAGLAPILLVGIGGWFYFHPSIFAASWNVSGHSPFTAAPNAVVIAFWAFLGVENAIVIAPLVRDPARNVPVATFGGLAIGVAVYLSACVVIMGILPASVLAKSSAPFAAAAAPIVGGSIAGVLALCAMLKSAGTLGGAILVTAETAESDAVLGQIVPGRPPRRADKPPTFNIILMGVLMTATVIASASPTLARQFTIVAEISVVLSLIAYLAGCVALLRFSGAVARERRMLVRAVAVGGAVFCCGAIAASEPDLLIWTLAAVSVASLAWLPVWLRRRRLLIAPKPA